VGTELVAGLGAVPDSVLLGAGQDGDGLSELAVGWQLAVGVRVGAQDVRQHHRVEVVGLLARDGLPFAVAGGGHRVDGVDGATGRPEAGNEQAAGGLDRHRYPLAGVVAVLGQQVEQLLQAGRVVADPGPAQELAVAVDHGDVVVVAGPVDPAEHRHGHLPVLPSDVHIRWSKTCAEARDSLMEGLRARHPISRS
jgi:hypothetical protein